MSRWILVLVAFALWFVGLAAVYVARARYHRRHLSTARDLGALADTLEVAGATAIPLALFALVVAFA
jgi:hypothetical protein